MLSMLALKFKNVKLERDELVGFVRQQKDLMKDFAARESDKVKKLKAQRDELMKSKQKLTNQLESIDMSNRSMTDKIEKLNSELEDVKSEREKYLTRKSIKDEEIEKMQSILTNKDLKETAMKENWNLMQKSLVVEEQRRRELIAEKEKIKYDLMERIKTLKIKLVEKKYGVAFDKEKCQLRDETIRKLFSIDMEANGIVAEKKQMITNLEKEIPDRDDLIRNEKQEMKNLEVEIAKLLADNFKSRVEMSERQKDKLARMQKENEALTEEFAALQKELEQAEMKRKETETKMENDKAGREKKLKDMEMELKKVKEKTKISREMLDRAERFNKELTATNTSLKEEYSRTNEVLLKMEPKIKNIIENWNSEKIRSKELSAEVAKMKDRVKILQEKLRKKKNKSKIRRLFENLRRRPHDNQ